MEEIVVAVHFTVPTAPVDPAENGLGPRHARARARHHLTRGVTTNSTRGPAVGRLVASTGLPPRHPLSKLGSLKPVAYMSRWSDAFKGVKYLCNQS